jgi:hypothetical protein
MKKGVLILLGMFMMVSTVEAKKGENLPNRFRVNYSYNNAVNFIERGIEFFIFTDGNFDFDNHFNNSYYDDGRGRTRNSNVRVNRDYRGRIRSIGNVYINYDSRGNVSRIGNISMRYYRGQLRKVGDLRVRYNRSGFPVFYGNVREFYYNNGIRFNISFGDVCNYNDTYFYRNDFRNNYTQFREDRNFYYYKARPNAKIGKRSTILKRRKPATKVYDKRIVQRNSKNSYRKLNSNKISVKKEIKRSTKKINRNNISLKADKNSRVIRINKSARKTTSPIIKRKSSTKKEIKNSRTLKTKKGIKKGVTNRKRRS